MCLFVFALFSILKNVQKGTTVDTVFYPDLISRLGFEIQVHFPFSPIYGFEVICNYLFYTFIFLFVILHIIITCCALLFYIMCVLFILIYIYMLVFILS